MQDSRGLKSIGRGLLVSAALALAGPTLVITVAQIDPYFPGTQMSQQEREVYGDLSMRVGLVGMGSIPLAVAGGLSLLGSYDARRRSEEDNE